MALTATVHHFTVHLSDVDRGVYETLELKLARHPSEADEYMVARVLAYCLEYTEGIAFSRGGLSDPDQPPLAVRDLTGVLKAWIEVGSPDAARLHKAAKSAPRVAVYTHKNPAQLLKQLDGERIHRAESLELFALDRELIAGLVKRLDRRVTLDLSLTDGHLYATVGGETLSGEVRRLSPA
ncbi:MAG TPA: YaeQ family protein [Burkholderiales bacterium]